MARVKLMSHGAGIISDRNSSGLLYFSGGSRNRLWREAVERSASKVNEENVTAIVPC